MRRTLPTPVSNLNGNSRESLVECCRAILTACTNLTDTIRNGSDLWHGRNFQTVPGGQHVQHRAQEEWQTRLKQLDKLHKEVLAMAIEIQGQR